MARKPHESKAEESRAGRKGGRSEGKAEHEKAGKDAHKKSEGHGSEHKMAEVHVHHHHHHHAGGAEKKPAGRKK